MLDRRRFLLGAGRPRDRRVCEEGKSIFSHGGRAADFANREEAEETLYVCSQDWAEPAYGKWRVSLGPDQPFAPRRSHMEGAPAQPRASPRHHARMSLAPARKMASAARKTWTGRSTASTGRTHGTTSTGRRRRRINLLKGLDLGSEPELEAAAGWAGHFRGVRGRSRVLRATRSCPSTTPSPRSDQPEHARMGSRPGNSSR